MALRLSSLLRYQETYLEWYEGLFHWCLFLHQKVVRSIVGKNAGKIAVLQLSLWS